MGRLTALLPFLFWFGAISLPPVKTIETLKFTNYILPCVYNDKTVNINLSIDNTFTDLERQDVFNGVCIALKAFRECKYLRKNWPAQKALGTDIIAHSFIFIHFDPEPDSPLCGYSYPYEKNNEIWLTEVAWIPNQCDRVSQIIFHEFLHQAMMPEHDYERTGRYLDPIETTVRMCLM